ncbi:MAG: PIN domain-containing protein [Planctomycetia bacterium]|nr:PIN domain-containing protein [Planctomycetia bacterium]
MLVDAGPLVAIFRRDDQHHAACLDALRTIVPPLLTSWPVVTEAAWLLRGSPPALQKLLSGPADALFQFLPLDETSLPELATLLGKYRNLQVQLADVSLVHLAVREKIDTVFTLDRRDFSVMRGAGNRAFRLLPELS